MEDNKQERSNSRRKLSFCRRNWRLWLIVGIVVLISIGVTFRELQPEPETIPSDVSTEDKTIEKESSKIWYVGADTHYDGSEKTENMIRAMVEDVNSFPTENAIILGDLFENDINLKEDFNNYMSDLDHDWTYVLGNHDADRNTGEVIKPVNNFSKIVNGIRIIAISDETPASTGGGSRNLNITEDTKDWIKKTLENNPDMPTVFMTHQPPVYSHVGFLGDWLRDDVDFWDSWLKDNIEDYNVIAWLSGHAHTWNIDEDAGGYGFTEILVGNVYDGHGHGIGNTGTRMTITDKGNVSEFKIEFRNHEDGKWVSVDGYQEYTIEIKTKEDAEWDDAKKVTD